MAVTYTEYKETKKRIKELRAFDKKLAKLARLREKHGEAAKKYADALIAKQVEKEIREMPISELAASKTGIRIAPLEDAGITKLFQIRNRSVSQLCAINGIGEATAKKIVKARDALIKTVEKNARIRISMDDKKKYSTEDNLVKSLYRARKSEEYRSAAEELYGANHEETAALIKRAKPASSKLRWFFTSEKRKEEAVAAAKELEEYTDDGGYIDEGERLFKERDAALKASHDEYWEDFARNAAGYYATLDGVRTEGTQVNRAKSPGLDKAREDAVKNGLPLDLAVAVEAVKPKLAGLNCTLRSYQYFGVQYILKQGAVLLGDEMGLGKTMQAIATMVSLRNEGATHFMVVCPASVLINWGREVAKFSDLKYIEIHGKDCLEEADKWINEGGVGITTYETIGKITLPEGFKLAILVADEAHYVKNPEAARTKALLKLREKTDRALFMTGTALENRIEEMQFLIGCLKPAVAKSIKSITSVTMAPDFREKVATVYFRRTKEDVLSELPEKTENELWCTMTGEESLPYCEAVKSKDFMAMRQVSWQCPIGVSSKAEQLKNICDQAVDSGRKIIVFSFFTNTIAKVQETLSDFAVFGPINGSIAPAKRQEIIDEFTNHKGGAVLVSQIQAGGTGLNIQAASVIVFTEPQLKPSLENQAIARAYRMGQVNTVLVYRLLCTKSVDERILNILKEKQKLFDNFADKSVSGDESLTFTDEDFENIMKEELERVS